MTMLVTWISPLRSLAACALALALVPSCVFAQKGGDNPKTPLDRTVRRQDRRDTKREIRREMKGKPGEAPGARGDGNRRPQLGRGAVIGRALGLLSLTADQRGALRRIRARSDERMRQHGRRVLDLRRQIDVDLFGPTFQLEEARRKGRELAAIVGERTTDRTNVEIAVFETLTPAQRAEVRAMRDEQRARMREAVRERMARPGERPEPSDGDAIESGPDDTGEDEEPDSMQAEPPNRRDGAQAPRRAQRRAGVPKLLLDLDVTPEQLRRLRQLRKQQAPMNRQAAVRYRDLQSRIDDLLVADVLDAAQLRTLAADLGRADAERELQRFQSEAGIREILTVEQARAFRERRRRQGTSEREADAPDSEPAARPATTP